MKNYFKSIFKAIFSLIKGFSVTGKYLFAPTVTVQYPDQKLTLADGYHGMLVFDKSICNGCGLCVRACPSQCITLTTKKDEATGKRYVESYEIINGRCNFCGLCEEACTVKGKAIKHTKEYEVIYYNRGEMVSKW